MGNFRTLDLAKEYYRMTRPLKLSLHLQKQFLSASSSVVLNLAEGNAKQSQREKFRFYEIAHGSFRESLTILDIDEINDKQIRLIADHLGASLYKLTRAIHN